MPYTELRDFHLYLHTPTPIFKARVNSPGTITYPLTALTFDGVTLGAFGDIQVDQTILLGTTDGADDLGRVRVQAAATSSTIPVGRVSQGKRDGELNVQDNAYITVLDEYRVWAKIPYSTGIVDYKDGNIEVGTFNEDILPVAVMGAAFADYIDPISEVITVTFDASDSYAMAEGATITAFAWDIADGSVTLGDIDEDTLTVEFPAGFRHVALTVTDSNGRTHTTRRPVLAVDPANDVTIPFAPQTRESSKTGVTFSFRLLNNLPRTTVPDGCLVLCWTDAPIDPTDRLHMFFVGWHQSDSFSIRAVKEGLVKDTVFNCVDVAGRLANLPAFPQALQREPEEDEEGNPIDIMWALMPTLDMRKCLHYLLYWHSTALTVADFLLADELDDYPTMRLDSNGGTLYDQVNSQANKAKPDHWLTCNWQGQLQIKPNWMLLDFEDRPADTAGTLTEDFWTSIEVTYQRSPRYFHIRAGAVLCSTDWIYIGGEPTLPLVFCDAPGTAFGQGASEQVTGEGLAQSQEQLNSCEGHRYEMLNASYGLFNIKEPTGDVQNFQPANMLPVQVNISAATQAQRGLDWTTARGLVHRVTEQFTVTEHGTWVQPTVQWEREVVGLPAVTHIPEVPDDPDFEVPEPPPGTVPPDFGLLPGQELVAGIGLDGYVYRTTDFQTDSGSGGPTWDRVDTTIADTIYSFVVDPFSPAYIDGAGTVNGWIVNDTDIYRVTDLFGTVVATSVFTFATATVAADFHWRSIQASFGTYFAEGVNPWLLCVSYYGDTVDHEGVWATHSTDGGATWSSEVQISEFYDLATPVRFNPIGVYASPKTPGLAYTAAYVAPPDDPVEKLPAFFHWSDASTPTGPFVAGLAKSNPAIVADAGLPVSQTTFISLHPPKDAVRVEVTALWSVVNTKTGGLGNVSCDIDTSDPITVSRVGDSDFSNPGAPGFAFGGFSQTFTLDSGTDWPSNRELVEVTPPTAPTQAVSWEVQQAANTTGEHEVTCEISLTIRVTEIELDGGEIYVPPLSAAASFVSSDWGATWTPTPLIEPGDALMGGVHLPWESNPTESLIYYGNASLTGNREFKLMKSDGGVISDISPEDTGVFYGVNDYGFTVRAYDSDRQKMAMAGIGNDTSDDPADDQVGLWVSSNAGTAWTNILAPVAASNAPRGLQIALGGDDSDVLFAWGGISSGSLPAISYSDDFGTLDDRTGNLETSFGDVVLIGIAGGAS